MLILENVGLRAIEKEDLKVLKNWRNSNDLRMYFREYKELNQRNQEEWFEKISSSNSKDIMFIIEDKEKKLMVGVCGLCYIDWKNRNAEFSIYIGHDNLYIDDLYAKIAGEILQKYAFDELNLHRLWVEVYEEDYKKNQYFLNLNFRKEGRFLDTHWTNGKWCNSIYYGKTKEID